MACTKVLTRNVRHSEESAEAVRPALSFARFSSSCTRPVSQQEATVDFPAALTATALSTSSNRTVPPDLTAARFDGIARSAVRLAPRGSGLRRQERDHG